MKIIQVDNFDRDNVADKLVCSNIENLLYGEAMLARLNTQFSGASASLYFRMVPDEHPLKVAEGT